MATEARRQARKFPQFSIYLPDDIECIVDKIAALEGKKRAQVVRDLVAEALVGRGLLAA